MAAFGGDANPMDGFLVIDKPAGWTSHDVVARVRRLARQKRVGHTGTLDPDATGVLLVCLGQATRLIEYTAAHHKTYVAGLTLGVETDSQDASGVVMARSDASGVTEADLFAVLPRFRGDISQVPPMVSAVHHEGKRLYELAREGRVVERAARPVTVYRLEAERFSPGPEAHAELLVECSGGTYVRTLCHDIGTALGVGGHMHCLRRTAVGSFSVEEAVALDTLTSEALPVALRSMDALLPNWPAIDGTDEQAGDIAHGRPIAAEACGSDAAFRHNGRFSAVLRRRDDGLWQPVKVFPLS